MKVIIFALTLMLIRIDNAVDDYNCSDNLYSLELALYKTKDNKLNLNNIYPTSK